MQNALAFEDVDHLVVDVAVIGCSARCDDAVELRHVSAADLLCHEVAKLAIPAGRQQRLVGEPNRAPTGSQRRSVRLRRNRRDGQQLLRSGVLDLVRLAGGEIDAGAGLELVLFAFDEHRPATGDCVNDLLDALEPSGQRAAGFVMRQMQLEEPRSRGRIDRGRP